MYQRNYDVILVFENLTTIIKNKTISWVLNEICKKNLVDLKAYLKLCNKILQIGYNIPIYLNQNEILCCFFNKRKSENYWFNYKEIKAVFPLNKKESILVFNNDTNINIKVNLSKIKNILSKCEKIEKYKNYKAISSYFI